MAITNEGQAYLLPDKILLEMSMKPVFKMESFRDATKTFFVFLFMSMALALAFNSMTFFVMSMFPVFLSFATCPYGETIAGKKPYLFWWPFIEYQV